MQDFFRFNNIAVVQPTSYSAQLATTSTEDSDRDQMLVMHNTPIATIESYEMGWKYIGVSDASTILKQVINKSSFLLHYFDLKEGRWRDGYFYASNFNSPCLTLEDDIECWDELSFNVIGKDPR
uniref:Uncharacterized protein n=1 Tax=Siphoviridae sp. ctmIh35 TaxID=2827932 RepID=A0A8S5TA41_9CAUD|nr:MAG TPA: hypothetical protein [Siphoviridae sp. ctmIh35]